MRHDLPSGGWVELDDIDTLKARDIKAITNALGLPDPDNPARLANRLDELISARMILAWHLPYLPDAPVPSVDRATLDELSAPDYRALDRLLAPATKAMFPGDPSPDQAIPGPNGEPPDPASPTQPGSEPQPA